MPVGGTPRALRGRSAGWRGALLLAGLCALLTASCGHGTPPPEPPGRPAVTEALPVPEDRAARDAAIQDVGERLFAAMREGHPEALLLDDVELRAILEPQAATQAAVLGATVPTRLAVTAADFELFAQAELSGACLQGARLEPAGGRLGLLSDGWIFERILVVGSRPDHRRVAAWVEGTFVYTNAGFGAIALYRTESPRWEHADLEIASCDMEVRLGDH